MQIDNILSKVHVDIDKPALLIDWDLTALKFFVRSANALVAPSPPPWITNAAGNMQPGTFTNDVMKLFASVGGYSVGRVLVASSNLGQYSNVLIRLMEITMNPFVQACLLPQPPGMHLATVYCLSEETVSAAQPIGLFAESGYRKAFQ